MELEENVIHELFQPAALCSCLLLLRTGVFCGYLYQGCDKQSEEMHNETKIGQNLTEFGPWDLDGRLNGNDFSNFQLFM